ncbi:homoserine O-acetyltransferase [Olivibacter sp. SDN3]|uniref:homoserine O-acetyltransferase family protein n=1 Tax=Olivibacter sp. SDN3 TaxID=2764720 RepID=UPI001650E866|nr:homoserine O-acetyltransferase [Olivibacter sp. SDN3]QNL48597.1 homoserine O-acetyltransferase [Olivibacter sp. SDN3]
MSIHKYSYNKTFRLESGKRLKGLEIAYHTYGRLNTRKDNVVWVCHALTANADVFDWWPGLFGENDLFNPQDHFIICANIIGSNYGTTNPLSINPTTGLPYYLAFPSFTIRDLAAAHELLAQHLGIDKIKVLIGGSLGGQQAMEWSILHPERVERLILLATNAQHSPWGIAFNESQRLAITADRTFFSNQPDGGAKGLKVARSIALLSYRTYETYGATQLETTDEKQDYFKASSYQNYQGEKLVKRFNAYSYWFLSKAMDAHNIGRGRNGAENALKIIRAQTLIVSITSDMLFPPEEQKFLAKYIPGAKHVSIDSFYGHDGFLIETKQISNAIAIFLGKVHPAAHNRSLQSLT